MRWRVYVVKTEELFPKRKGTFLRRMDASTYVHYLKKNGEQAYEVWSADDDDFPFSWNLLFTTDTYSRMMQ